MILKKWLPYRVKYNKFFYLFSYTDYKTYRECYTIFGLHFIYRWWHERVSKIYKSYLLKIFEYWLSKKFIVYPIDSINMYSPTDEEFIEFTSCGKFNNKLKRSFKTTFGAVFAYFKEIQKYIKNKKGVFYWRIRPELSGRFLSYAIYSRFLISDKSINKNKN